MTGRSDTTALDNSFQADADYIRAEVFLQSWTEKSLQDQRSTLGTFYGVFFGVGSMAWLAFGGACVWLFLQMALRVARKFHTMILETMLKFVLSFVVGCSAADYSTVHQWSSLPLPTVDAP